MATMKYRISTALHMGLMIEDANKRYDLYQVEVIVRRNS
jgi:hypothetical protein